ncbi:MAG TPA: periplasmic heavy metal sensor [bacterium]|nr:periplasmic heavy metal sensor [bacterium]
MISWKTLLAGFLIGLIAGGGWGAWYAKEHGHFWDKPGGREVRLLKEFTRELDLTDAQRASVSAILQSQRGRIKAIRSEIRPRMEEIREQAGGEIRALLGPDQQERFDVLQMRMKEERRKREENR